MENVFLFHKDLVKIKTDEGVAQKIIDNALNVLRGPIPEAAEKCNYCKYRETKVSFEPPEIDVTKKTSLLDY